MSFHEKSAWACLSAILIVYVPYFVIVFSHPGYLVVPPAFIGAVIVLVVILGVSHTILAIHSASIRKTGEVPERDEREIGIELSAMKISSYVLSVAVITWCIFAYVGIPVSRVKHQQEITSVTEYQTDGRQVLVGQASAKQNQRDLSLSNLLPIPAHGALFFVHALMMGFVMANIVYYAAVVFGYRRSV
jgi:hypothetical protein